MKFKVILIGYDTLDYGSVKRSIEVEASTLEEAKEKGQQWCKENSSMGGYDYFVDGVRRDD